MPAYPLSGFRVVDFGWVMAGPIAGFLLADMGAEVIKVETRKRVDATRRGIPVYKATPEEELELLPGFNAINRGKLGITVDLADPRGKELVKALVRASDAVTENFSPRVLQELELDYDALKKVKPDIVMLSLSSQGQHGPLHDVTTYANSLAALGGIYSLNGYYGETIPTRIQTAYADALGGIHGAIAVMMALYHRQMTGEGQYIDCSQMEAAVCLVGEGIMDYSMNKRDQVPQGNRHPAMAPHGNYPCQGEDKWVAIAVKSEEEWQALCQAMGNPAWAKESHFIDRFSRLQHWQELDKRISQWTWQSTPAEVTEMLQKVGVAATPVMSILEKHDDPHYQARQVFVEVEHPKIGRASIPNVTWKLSDTPGRVQGPAPLLGQHNEYIFGQVLGYSHAQIAQLIEEQVIY